MAQSLKLSDESMALLREASLTHHRSLAGQAEHWMRLGRAFEAHPQAGFEQVQAALRGELSVDDLDPADRQRFFTNYMQTAATPSADEAAFFRQRSQRDAPSVTAQPRRKKVAGMSR